MATACSIFKWENGVSTPDFRKLPAIIAFLGYNLLPEPTGEAEQLVWERRSIGLSQRGRVLIRGRWRSGSKAAV